MSIELGAKHVSNLNRANACWGACKNEIAGFERYVLRHIRNDRIDAENKIFRVACLSEFAVLKQFEFGCLKVYLCFFNPGIGKWRTVVKTFGFLPRQAVCFAVFLDVAGSKINAKREMSIVFMRKFRWYMLANFFYAHHKLTFKMEVLGKSWVIKISFSE